MSDNRDRPDDGSPKRSGAVTVVDENRRRMVRAGLIASRPTLVDRDDMDDLNNLIHRPIQIEVENRTVLISTLTVMEIVPTSRRSHDTPSFSRYRDIVDAEHETIEEAPVQTADRRTVDGDVPVPEHVDEGPTGSTVPDTDPEDIEIVAVDEHTGARLVLNYRTLSKAMHPGIHTSSADPSIVSARIGTVEAARNESERRARRMLADLAAQASNPSGADDLPFADKLLVDATIIEATNPEIAARLRSASKEIETLNVGVAKGEATMAMLVEKVDELESVKVSVKPTRADRIGAGPAPSDRSGRSLLDVVRRTIGLGS